MRTIAIINQKGGSGKTTTSVNLAAALGALKRHILVIDLDPQASTTSWFGVETTHQNASESSGANTKSDGARTYKSGNLMDVMTSDMPLADAITTTQTPGVDLIAGSSWLIGLEKKLAQEVGAEALLKQKIQECDSAAYDYVLIDCPPALSLLTINALNAVHEVLVPVETRIMALQGLVQLLQTIDVIKKRLNGNLRLSGVLACRVDMRTKHSKEVVDELRKNFGPLVYETVIRENIKLAECPSFKQAIISYAPDSSGALDYGALAQEIIVQEAPQAHTVSMNQSSSHTSHKGVLHVRA